MSGLSLGRDKKQILLYFFFSRMSSCREAAVDKMIKSEARSEYRRTNKIMGFETDKTPLNKLFVYQLYVGHAFEKQTRRRTNHSDDYTINDTISTRAVVGFGMCLYGNRKYEVFREKEVAMPNIAFLKRGTSSGL